MVLLGTFQARVGLKISKLRDRCVASSSSRRRSVTFPAPRSPSNALRIGWPTTGVTPVTTKSARVWRSWAFHCVFSFQSVISLIFLTFALAYS